jgi:hypothetical protein
MITQRNPESLADLSLEIQLPFFDKLPKRKLMDLNIFDELTLPNV